MELHVSINTVSLENGVICIYKHYNCSMELHVFINTVTLFPFPISALEALQKWYPMKGTKGLNLGPQTLTGSACPPSAPGLRPISHGPA